MAYEETETKLSALRDQYDIQYGRNIRRGRDTRSEIPRRVTYKKDLMQEALDYIAYLKSQL